MTRWCRRLVLLAVLGGLAGCGRESMPSSAQFRYLSYPVQVEVPEHENHRLRGATSVVRNELADLKKVFDWTDPNSEYSRMNDVAGTVWLPISHNLERLLRYALDYNVKTRGTFDVTITPLSQIWGFEGAEVPLYVPAEVVAAGLMVTGLDRVALANNAVRYEVDVLYLNFSGMLEGYLTDLSLIRARNHNYRNVLIKVGNCYRHLGEATPGEAWQALVVHPFEEEVVLGTVTFTNKVGMAVSSIRERYNVINGQEVGHIIDPRTGYPAREIVQTVVVGPTATASDVLATALTVGGVEEGPAIMYNFPRYHAMMVVNEQPLKIWMTEGMAEYIELNNVPEGSIHVLPVYEPSEEELAGATPPPSRKLPDWDMRVFHRPAEVKKKLAEDARKEAEEDARWKAEREAELKRR